MPSSISRTRSARENVRDENPELQLGLQPGTANLDAAHKPGTESRSHPSFREVHSQWATGLPWRESSVRRFQRRGFIAIYVDKVGGNNSPLSDQIIIVHVADELGRILDIEFFEDIASMFAHRLLANGKNFTYLFAADAIADQFGDLLFPVR